MGYHKMTSLEAENLVKFKDDPLHKEAMKELRCFVFASIISADNDNYTEEQKQEVIRRHKESNDWKYILEPVDDTGKFAKLFNYNDDGESIQN